MKLNEVQVGGRYTAKVSGKVQVVPNDLNCLWAGWLPDGRILINAQTPAGPRMFIQARDGKPPVPVTPSA